MGCVSWFPINRSSRTALLLAGVAEAEPEVLFAAEVSDTEGTQDADVGIGRGRSADDFLSEFRFKCVNYLASVCKLVHACFVGVVHVEEYHVGIVFADEFQRLLWRLCQAWVGRFVACFLYTGYHQRNPKITIFYNQHSHFLSPFLLVFKRSFGKLFSRSEFASGEVDSEPEASFVFCLPVKFGSESSQKRRSSQRIARCGNFCEDPCAKGGFGFRLRLIFACRLQVKERTPPRTPHGCGATVRIQQKVSVSVSETLFVDPFGSADVQGKEFGEIVGCWDTGAWSLDDDEGLGAGRIGPGVLDVALGELLGYVADAV